ncbi:flagellar basal body rod modification protein [Pandoraea fibrosis]|uniref:Basal-body rod modification protein FlgD n=1 Tax=Pandoraea fibrosis TaxID=1891094 RepID=A0ABX6HXE9_9BURK|nr:flagellar hook capping FlgD N-terminal domain-containing protein [Pandoraea fibrosis]QHE91283.1 flagellar basal body rod modification protein [Pandoraea fibrosis]QHF15160.1 flagellar basal body rod modification protein [Pandoraea fibrosis]
MTLPIGSIGNTGNHAGALSAPANTAAAPASAGDAGDDIRMMFTKLLVAQIRHQDPLNPTDPAQFVAQLTQLSQTETMQQVSQRMLTQTKVLSGLQGYTLGNHVGREVSVETPGIDRVSGRGVRGSVDLPVGSEGAEIVLTSHDGKTVRKPLPVSAGRTEFHIDDAWFTEHNLGAGRFDIHVQSGTTKLPVRIAGRVERVHLDGAGAQIDVTGVGSRIDAANIKELSASAPPGAAKHGSAA